MWLLEREVVLRPQAVVALAALAALAVARVEVGARVAREAAVRVTVRAALVVVEVAEGLVMTGPEVIQRVQAVAPVVAQARGRVATARVAAAARVAARVVLEVPLVDSLEVAAEVTVAGPGVVLGRPRSQALAPVQSVRLQTLQRLSVTADLGQAASLQVAGREHAQASQGAGQRAPRRFRRSKIPRAGGSPPRPPPAVEPTPRGQAAREARRCRARV